MSPSTLSRAAAAAAILASTASAAFNPASPRNVAIYWGQGAGQQTLSEVCEDPTVDVVNIGFVNGFPAKIGDYPKTNFGNACWAGYYKHPTDPSQNEKLLSTCPTIEPGINKCRQNNKKVLLSLGGGAPTDYYLPSEPVAKYFAEFLIGAFGRKSPSWTGPRPFGDAYVDGFDLDLEADADKVPNTGFISANYAYFVNQLKAIQPSLLISAAPQCQVPDPRLADAISKAPFDMIFTQFYNTPECSAKLGYQQLNQPTTGFTFNKWAEWLKTNSKNKGVKLYLGLAAGEAGIPYHKDHYLSPREADALITKWKGQYPGIFGGVMLWEAKVSKDNKNWCQTYSYWIKSTLEGTFSSQYSSKACVTSSSIAPSSTKASSTVASSTSAAVTSTATISSSSSSQVVSSSSSSQVVSSSSSSQVVSSSSSSQVVSSSSSSQAVSSSSSSQVVSSSASATPSASASSSSVISSSSVDVSSSIPASSSSASVHASSTESAQVSSSAVSSSASAVSSSASESEASSSDVPYPTGNSTSVPHTTDAHSSTATPTIVYPYETTKLYPHSSSSSVHYGNATTPCSTSTLAPSSTPGYGASTTPDAPVYGASSSSTPGAPVYGASSSSTPGAPVYGASSSPAPYDSYPASSYPPSVSSLPGNGYPVYPASSTVTVVTTTYVDACETGVTTKTETITQTVCNKCKEDSVTSIYVCKKCGPSEVTVTITKPHTPATDVPSYPTPPAKPEGPTYGGDKPEGPAKPSTPPSYGGDKPEGPAQPSTPTYGGDKPEGPAQPSTPPTYGGDKPSNPPTYGGDKPEGPAKPSTPPTYGGDVPKKHEVPATSTTVSIVYVSKTPVPDVPEVKHTPVPYPSGPAVEYPNKPVGTGVPSKPSGTGVPTKPTATGVPTKPTAYVPPPQFTGAASHVGVGMTGLLAVVAGLMVL